MRKPNDSKGSVIKNKSPEWDFGIIFTYLMNKSCTYIDDFFLYLSQALLLSSTPNLFHFIYLPRKIM